MSLVFGLEDIEKEFDVACIEVRKMQAEVTATSARDAEDDVVK